MMRRAKPRSKGPVVKLERIDRLAARIRSEKGKLDSAPHPHAEDTLQPVKVIREEITGQRRPVVQSILDTGCPPDCPVQARKLQLYKRLMRLGEMQRSLLVELARSRAKARRSGSVVTVEMYEQARARAASSKHPRAELARQLGLSRQGLVDWELKYLR